MADTSDFNATHPVPPQPPGTPERQRLNIARLEVATEPCRYGRCPPEHNHPDPYDPSASGYWPEPEEFATGWTTQHIPKSKDGHLVPKYCILCWSLEDNLLAHICCVVETLSA